MSRRLALVYGALPEKQFGHHWIVHKHIETGELLGPAVSGHIPTRFVHARLTREGWVEVEHAPAG